MAFSKKDSHNINVQQTHSSDTKNVPVISNSDSYVGCKQVWRYKIKILLMIVLFLITIESVNADLAQPRKVVSVKDDHISTLHFFDVSVDTFDKEKVDFNKGWIGIYMKNVPEKGILVKMVVKGSPADTSGLKSGDFITEINGSIVIGGDNSNLARFKKIIEDAGKDTVVHLTVVRDGKTRDINVKLFGKLLDRAHGYGKTKKKQSWPLFVDKFKERALSYDESFLELAFNDEEFRDKCSGTLQRIGEEVFVREGYQDSRAVGNAFRLPLIDHLMTHPFDVPYSVNILHDSLVGQSLSETFKEAINLLGFSMEKEINKTDIKGDANAQTIIENIIKSIYNCMELRKEALDSLTIDEFRFLYDKAPDVLFDSNRSDETGAETVANFLDISGKIDMPKLMESFRLVVDSLPLKFLQKIKPELNPGDFELHQFGLPDRGNFAFKNSVPDDSSGLKEYMSGFAGDVLFVQDTEIGRIVVGGAGTTYYYDDAALIIDIGGNDFYFNNAGSSVTDAPVSICLDFSGNDVYIAKQPFSQGSGRFGIGILMDLDGDDRYIGNDYSQGVGMFGVGLLYDTNGDDLYEAQTMCQGGGAFGIGLLRDSGG